MRGLREDCQDVSITKPWFPHLCGRIWKRGFFQKDQKWGPPCWGRCLSSETLWGSQVGRESEAMVFLPPSPPRLVTLGPSPGESGGRAGRQAWPSL